jgi:ribose-phosphate pyrophosphokinase
MNDKPLVLGFPEYAIPSRRLADALGAAWEPVEVHHFPDGESKVCVPEHLPKRVVFCRSLDRPNDKLIELLLASSRARERGAEQLTLVAPYLCYMRQDTAFRPGEAVSQRVIGRLLAEYFDELVTVDPHLHRTRTLEEAVPARRAVALCAAAPLRAFLLEHTRRPFLIGPDGESAQWVHAIATPAGLDYAVGEKRRLGDHEVHITLPDVELRGREVVLVDDVASTGRTLAGAAAEIRRRGAATVRVLVSHALLVGDAEAQLSAAGVADLWSTDSVPHASNVVPLAGLLARALEPLPPD